MTQKKDVSRSPSLYKPRRANGLIASRDHNDDRPAKAGEKLPRELHRNFFARNPVNHRVLVGV